MAKKLNSSDYEKINEMLVQGKRYSEIASMYDVAISTLFEFLHKPEFSARTRDALALSASMYANKGEEVLIAAKSNMTEIQRARELAQHYRWMAAKRNPKKYGDKLQVDSNITETKEIFKIGGETFEL